MDPAEVFTQRTVQRLGEMTYFIMRLEVELDQARQYIAQLEQEKHGDSSPAKSAS